MNSSDKEIKWVVTCEHGGRKIPRKFHHLFQDKMEHLNSHRGEDIGVKKAFNEFKPVADFWIINEYSRLLIELNRSPHHPMLFSEFSRELSEEDKEYLVRHYYFPYRNKIEQAIDGFLKEGFRVVHLSIHSFTPVLNGEIRNADLGLLYDPARDDEQEFCWSWRRSFIRELSKLKIRMNYPYLGKADGLATALRKKYVKDYVGVEVEFNQKLEKDFARIARIMIACLKVDKKL